MQLNGSFQWVVMVTRRVEQQKSITRPLFYLSLARVTQVKAIRGRDTLKYQLTAARTALRKLPSC